MDCKEKMIICKWKLTGTKGIGSLYMDECQGSVVFRLLWVKLKMKEEIMFLFEPSLHCWTKTSKWLAVNNNIEFSEYKWTSNHYFNCIFNKMKSSRSSNNTYLGTNSGFMLRYCIFYSMGLSFLEAPCSHYGFSNWQFFLRSGTWS